MDNVKEKVFAQIDTLCQDYRTAFKATVLPYLSLLDATERERAQIERLYTSTMLDYDNLNTIVKAQREQLAEVKKRALQVLDARENYTVRAGHLMEYLQSIQE